MLEVAQKILENISNWLIQQGSTMEMIDFSLPDLPLTFLEPLLSTWMEKFKYKWQYNNSIQIPIILIYQIDCNRFKMPQGLKLFS